MSAMRLSTPGRLELVHLGPLPAITERRYVGWLVIEHRSDPVPNTRAGSFSGKVYPKRVTEARRTNNREAARRYRARQRAQRGV